MSNSKRKTSGFTLIELIIAMLIASVLAAIAIPSYSNYVRKSRRTEAKTALLDMASLEERFYSTNNTYSSTLSDLGYGSGTLASGYYTVTATSALPTTLNPATYTLTANVVAGTDQVKDTNCQSFTLTNQGVQTATPDTTPPTCWQR